MGSSRGGGFAVGAADPLFGIFDESGKAVVIRTAPVANFYSDQHGKFLLADDGSEVCFPFDREGTIARRWSVAERLLDGSPGDTRKLHPPTLSAVGATVTINENTASACVNGISLKLDPYEKFRAADVAPDGKAVLAGGEWSLRLFDTNGARSGKPPFRGRPDT
jgi:hypothetical protein